LFGKNFPSFENLESLKQALNGRKSLNLSRLTGSAGSVAEIGTKKFV
jgi:hypothetical protein